MGTLPQAKTLSIKISQQEIERYLAKVESVAHLVTCKTLLASIVAETKPEPDGSRLVAIGGGWRRLPDDMARLINEAAALLGQGR